MSVRTAFQAAQAMEQMESLFFETSTTGLLVYNDPALGTFENHKLDLRIRVDLEGLFLVLESHGLDVASFDLTLGVPEALEAAAMSYWRAIQDGGRVTRRETALWGDDFELVNDAAPKRRLFSGQRCAFPAAVENDCD